MIMIRGHTVAAITVCTARSRNRMHGKNSGEESPHWKQEPFSTPIQMRRENDSEISGLGLTQGRTHRDFAGETSGTAI